jgi:hypothetical protein
MTAQDPRDVYANRDADKDRKTQALRVKQYNAWTDIINEIIRSFLRHVEQGRVPDEFVYIIENDTRVESWRILRYSTPTLVNLTFDGRLVVIESRPFYTPPKRKWWQFWIPKKEPVFISRHDKHVVAEVRLEHIDPDTHWTEWDKQWRLRHTLFEVLARSNSLLHLPSDEFAARLRRVTRDHDLLHDPHGHH